MYGKIFESTFTGSMVGSGADVFAVWAYVIAHAKDSAVELNPALIGAAIGISKDAAAVAIEFLTQPDHDSRNADCEGRRLVREGVFQYRVVSHKMYREMRNEEERREYNRIKQKEHRARKRGASNEVSMTVIDMSAVSSHTEAEAYTKNKGASVADAPEFVLESPKTEKAASRKHSQGDIQRVYDAYPHKKKPADARKAIAKAFSKLAARGESDPAGFLIGRIEAWEASRKRDASAGRFVPNYPYPASWFNGECYDEAYALPADRTAGETKTTHHDPYAELEAHINAPIVPTPWNGLMEAAR